MKNPIKKGLRFCAYLVLMGCVISAATQPLSAQVAIPQYSTITSAAFSIYITGAGVQTVSLHRITADWGEDTVTWANFTGHYDPAWAGSFFADDSGWKIIDVTALVQSWVNGEYPNYGFVMMQGLTEATTYASSEFVPLTNGPKLEISYVAPNGVSGSAVIQCTELDPDCVADAYVWELNPNSNYNYNTLYTGNVFGKEKYSLVRFDFTVTPPSQPGTGTPGYWMNHPEAWPVESIVIGGISYPKAEAIRLMRLPVSNDKTYTMFAALVAAKLNILIGNEAGCVQGTITSADSWMAGYPVGSGVKAGGTTSPWRVGDPLCQILDNYNNGFLCAPHRD